MVIHYRSSLRGWGGAVFFRMIFVLVRTIAAMALGSVKKLHLVFSCILVMILGNQS